MSLFFVLLVILVEIRGIAIASVARLCPFSGAQHSDKFDSLRQIKNPPDDGFLFACLKVLGLIQLHVSLNGVAFWSLGIQNG